MTECPALVLAPKGRDAVVAIALLEKARTPAVICRDLRFLAHALGDHVCCVIVTEEELRADLEPISSWVTAQPAWSDLPFIVLTRRVAVDGDRAQAVAHMTKSLGNVTFVERPFHPSTFVSVIAAAVRARHRQYEARRSIEAVREGEARLRTALLAGHLGAWELDVATQELTASETCKAIFGRKPQHTFTCADLMDGVYPDDRARMREAMSRSVQTGADYTIEHRLRWPDGTLRWVDFRARFVPGDAHGTGRLVGVCLDVTERIAAEDALRRANELLEMKVGERTAELEHSHRVVLEEVRRREETEYQLRHVQKLEMIGQLSGGIAHDFNNLLAAILGNLELARKEASSHPRLVRLIEGAQLGARRGATLTQRLLASARQQELDVAPARLSDLVLGMLDLVERSIGPTIHLHTEIPDDLPLTLVDANQIELALLNLVVNSRDAMPRGGRLTIATDSTTWAGDPDLPAGQYVRVTVRDSGIGMDAATLAKAGEPFFTTKGVGKGTGLGLSMIHGLARQLSGALRISSTPGQGTQATLWLPALAPDAAPTLSEPNMPAAAPVQAEASGTILVVDDDSLVAASTALLLEDMGHAVVAADSGDAALEILQSDAAVDVLLTDYSMPYMSGAELASAARSLRPHLPIILATGYAELPDIDPSVLHLRKPYQREQLLTQVNLALHLCRGT